ncbi:MAG: YitT family protein [Tissierellia bacterium]|nr:YitT family protein [Tissierellia bacterium]
MSKELMEGIKSKKVKNVLQKLSIILIGNLLCSIAYNVFFIPSKLLSGGVGGMGILIQYLTNIPTGISVLAINIPIFILGFKLVNREFAIYSFISMFVFSLFLTLTYGLGKYFIIDDILLASIFGGVLNGIGAGLMFRNQMSQGGLDIIAAVIKIRHDINIGTVLMAFNTIIISLSSLLFGYRSAMYTLMALYIGYRILDKVQTGFNAKKNVMIVSDKPEEVAEAIIEELNMGVTFLQGIGGYTKEDKIVIYCIVMSNQTAKLKDIVDTIDPNALLVISEAVEVTGKGFHSLGV